ncbi:hypothetical protein ACQEVF_11430 [Nonomuraea polychroma]|uniref:hypothetical protein n=1 Tax=Nonomuraea polychroma TaxID=46176 RepID=UPI003D8B85FC
MGNSYPYSGNFGGEGFQPSSGISFTKEELERAGGQINGHLDFLKGLGGKAGNLSVNWPHFGVIGVGVHLAHENVIQIQREALERAHKALATWEPALSAADRNYQEADDGSGDPIGTGDVPGAGDLGGPGDIPGGMENVGLPEVKLPDGTLPDGTLPDGTLPDGTLPDGTLPDGTLPDGTLPDGTLPDGTLPDGDLPGSDLPGTDTPTTDLPDPNLPGTNLPQQNLPSTDPADMKVPDIDSALNNPAKTDLSSFQPTTPQIPGNVPSVDPGLSTRTGPSVFGGPGGSMGTGAGPNGGFPGATAAMRGVGAGGMPMPFMPMGAGANGNEERDRESTVGLSEDEGVWGGDEDIAPQVIGQEES